MLAYCKHTLYLSCYCLSRDVQWSSEPFLFTQGNRKVVIAILSFHWLIAWLHINILWFNLEIKLHLSICTLLYKHIHLSGDGLSLYWGIFNIIMNCGAEHLFSAQIQQLKHGVPKGDKKRKREMTSQVAQLEAQLSEKHETEVQQWTEQQKVSN